MKKFVSMLLLSLTLITGAAFAAQARGRDQDDRDRDKVVRVVPRSNGRTTIIRRDGRAFIRHRRHPRRYYGPTIVRRRY